MESTGKRTFKCAECATALVGVPCLLLGKGRLCLDCVHSLQVEHNGPTDIRKFAPWYRAARAATPMARENIELRAKVAELEKLIDENIAVANRGRTGQPDQNRRLLGDQNARR